ncbi:MAG TPA: multiheme c-type cytochrome [Candidatus Binatia bacterium]
MRLRPHACIAGVIASLLVLSTDPGPAAEGATRTAATAAAPTPAAPAAPDQSRLPAFEGRTLDGKRLSTSSFGGKRLILLCFNPGVAQAGIYAEALAKLAPEQRSNNFEIAGVAMGLDPAKAREFATKFKLDFPIFDDSDGNIGLRLSLQSPLMLVGSDADGRVGLAMASFEHDDGGATVSAVEARIREYLRMPKSGAAAGGALDSRPLAPTFEADHVGGGGSHFRLADLSGKPVVLAFFLSTCPHCQQALTFFKAELARIPEKSRPVFVGIAIDTRAWEVKSTLEEKKLDFFSPLSDPDGRIAASYSSFAGVPDVLLIDGTGHIVYREKGWNEKHAPDLLRMRLASLAGLEVPMLLDHDGYSGNDVCAVCHVKEASAWHFTDHSAAFDDLVTRGADHDPKCVGCHVVGFGERGGYSEQAPEKFFEGVGCEDCHGRGGGHLATKAKGAAAAHGTVDGHICEKCHDPEHSLGFDYAKFLPKVSHAAIAALSDPERAKLVSGRGQPRDLLPASSAIVGSMACRSCHEREYSTWSHSAHARSTESLVSDRKGSDPKCVHCHVTGYARAGGFPDGGKLNAGDDLARVGCESCHGGGADHVRSGGKQAASIVRLGDKCDTCVILQICGTCHDDANDPDFRFNVVHKIDAQRHGTAQQAAAAQPAH